MSKNKTAFERVKNGYQEMLSDNEGEESSGWYGWISLEDVKELLKDYAELQKKLEWNQSSYEALELQINGAVARLGNQTEKIHTLEKQLAVEKRVIEKIYDALHRPMTGTLGTLLIELCESAGFDCSNPENYISPEVKP